jgi:hypothetical protein
MTKDERIDLKSTLIEALNSKEGQEAIKKAALDALKSKEADEILFDYFLKAFKEVVLPGLDKLQEDVNMLKEDISDMAIDLKYFKEKETRTEKYVQDLREKVFRRRAT